MKLVFSLLAGAAAGFLTGAGLGGGTLLMLWLTQIAGLPQLAAQSVNLLYFLLTAPPALYGHQKQGLVRWTVVKKALLPGIPMAIAGAWLAAGTEQTLLRRGFGLLCVAIGLRELLTKRPR